MTKQQAGVIRRAMQQARGDDLYRAQSAFKGHNLTDQYGQSGKTKRQILDEYQEHDDLWKSANDALEGLLGKAGV